MVGDVRPYEGAYQAGMGGKTGDGENDQVWHVQHPEQTKQGSGIGPLWDGTGTGKLWSYTGDEAHRRIYMQESSGFWVIAMEAPSAHHGGITILYQEAEHFTI